MAIKTNEIRKFGFLGGGITAFLVALVATLLLAQSIYPLLFISLLSFAAIIALLYALRPDWSIFTFILVLPFHSLIVTILIARFGVSIGIAKIFASWKETLLIFTLISVAIHGVLRHRSIKIVWTDILAMVWMYQILFYFVFHSILFDWQASLSIRLYGARDWMLYLLPYFIGRFIIISEKSAREVLRTIALVGFITSAIGIAEYVLVPTEWHVALGVPRYYSAFLNVQYTDNFLGLPPNYWVRIDNVIIRRAVSVYLSGQGFAVPFLLVTPAIIYYHFSMKRSKRSLLMMIVCAVALLLAITRMTLLACFIETLVLLGLLGKRRAVIAILTLLVIAVVAILVRYANVRDFVVATLTFQDDSSRARPEQWLNGLQMLVDHPLGLGLGSTGQTSARFGLSGIGTEAGYFKLAGALGFPGLLFFFGWFIGILRYAFLACHSGTTAWRGIALVTFVTAIGFLLNNITAPPDQSPFVIYIFCLLAGLAVQQATALRMATRAHDRAVVFP